MDAPLQPCFLTAFAQCDVPFYQDLSHDHDEADTTENVYCLYLDLHVSGFTASTVKSR